MGNIIRTRPKVSICGRRQDSGLQLPLQNGKVTFCSLKIVAAMTKKPRVPFLMQKLVFSVAKRLQGQRFPSICSSYEFKSVLNKVSYGINKRQQASTSVIKRHQASSCVFKRYQASSSVIKRHQESSRVIKHHQVSSSNIKRHQASLGIIKHHQASSSVIKH